MRTYILISLLLALSINAWSQSITGTVSTPLGVPLPGVGVSDGITIVTTNSKGEYSMQSDKKYGYVFVICPSGYAAPLKEDGMRADFWKKTTKDGKEAEVINFTLVPQDQSQYNVLFTTDIHLNHHPRQHDLQRFHKYAMPNIRHIIKDFQAAQQPYYVFHLGDVSTDIHWYELNFSIDSAYAHLLEEKFPGPFYNIPGNHDNDPDIIGKDVDFRSEWRYRNIFGPTYYSMNIGKDHWIMIDDMMYQNTPFGKSKKTGPHPAEGTPQVRGERNFKVGFTPHQMEWLRQDLALMPEGYTPRLCTHASLLFEYPEGKGTQFTENSQLDTIVEMLSAYDGILHAYSGHTHRFQFARNDHFPKIEDLMLPATSGNVWGTGHEQLLGIDASDAGCVTAHFEGKKVTYDYSTHLYGKKYMRLYDMNTVMEYYQTDSITQSRLKKFPLRTDYGKPEYRNMIYANIWDARPDDVIRMYEDGKELKVSQVRQSDPLLLIGKVLGNALFIKPQYPICYHLFAAQATTAQKPVTVKVFSKQGILRHHETIIRPKKFSKDMQ